MSTVLVFAVLLAALAACAFSALGWAAARRPASASPELLQRLGSFEAQLARLPEAQREDLRGLRAELRDVLGGLDQAHDTRISNLGGRLDHRLESFGVGQGEHLRGLRQETAEGQARFDEALKRETAAFAAAQAARLAETNAAVGALADRLERQQKEAREGLIQSLAAAASAQKAGLDGVDQRLRALLDANEARQAALRDTLTASLDKLRADNTDKLEQMRATVDEKLQGTLEQRLGESFKLVSERLDTVHKGMGEMQAMAVEVGGLKRVMSNVRARGAYGEVQLGALLGDTLTADQYERQAQVKPGSAERVDYAIVLPGQDVEGRLLVPIDCKYPHEDYERLLAAHDAGDAAAAEEAGRALERAIRVQARSISEKYVHPPTTTDFALMYLPSEGLYAEVARRPGLIADLQAHPLHVTIAGPTTLQAILGGFRMVFRTLLVEKRAGEIARVLGEAKAEFQKYGQVGQAGKAALHRPEHRRRSRQAHPRCGAPPARGGGGGGRRRRRRGAGPAGAGRPGAGRRGVMALRLSSGAVDRGPGPASRRSRPTHASGAADASEPRLAHALSDQQQSEHQSR